MTLRGGYMQVDQLVVCKNASCITSLDLVLSITFIYLFLSQSATLPYFMY